MENRAAVFTSEPQAIEVYQAGAWWSGELLGWRHAADGSCQVWVRVVLGGVEETAWTDLTTLRLPESRPERHLSMAPEPVSAAVREREESVARHPASRRERAAEADASATTHLPAVRDLSVVPAPSAGGRRRAPEEPAPSAGGRRRAPEAAVVASTGGRRRAPEEPQASTGGRRRAPETAEASAVSPSALGRHRAPGLRGRHSTADTGLLPAVSADTAAPSPVPHRRPTPSPRAGRPDGPVVGTGSSTWTAPTGLESELLTRPMRLSDHVPHARRPRLDGALRGV